MVPIALARWKVGDLYTIHSFFKTKKTPTRSSHTKSKPPFDHIVIFDLPLPCTG